MGMGGRVKDLSLAAAPLELILKGGDSNKTIVWACGTCHFTRSSQADALECCAPFICEKCGKTNKSYCEACVKKAQDAKAQERYDKAQKVPYAEYTGEMICCPHCNEYYSDVDAYLYAHDDSDVHTWVWGTYAMPLTLNAEQVIYDQLEQQEFYENAAENIPKDALKEMQEFFDAWLKKYGLTSYMEDNDVVVDVTKEVEAFLKEET